MATIKSCSLGLYRPVVTLMLLCAAPALGQLSFHNDPSQNSFSIKLPAFQQTFTRYFGNQQQGALLQQQQQQQQQQQPIAQQQQSPGAVNHPSALANQAQSYQLQQQQQQQQQQQPDNFNRYVAHFPEQPHYTVQDNYINPNIRLRLQQQRLQQQQPQQQQVQPQQYYPQATNYQGLSFGAPQPGQDANAYGAANQQPQYEYIQQPSGPDGASGGVQEQPAQYQPAAQPQRGHQQQAGYSQLAPGGEVDPSASNKLIGVAFSPSNEVSQVKFSSNGLKYNF